MVSGIVVRWTDTRGLENYQWFGGLMPVARWTDTHNLMNSIDTSGDIYQNDNELGLQSEFPDKLTKTND